MFRDSVYFLREWIEFHLMMGVERFYLCDNRSVDGPIEVLAPYIHRGIVVLVHSDDNARDRFALGLQIVYFMAVIKAVRDRVTWLACIDTDEFLMPSRPTDATLLDVLQRHEDASAIAVNWQMYGASGVHRKPDDALVIETLLRKAPTDDEENHHVKLIVRPECVREFLTPHSVERMPSAPHPMRMTDRSITIDDEQNFSPRVVIDELRLHHYMAGDIEYFERYKVPAYRGRAMPPERYASVAGRAKRGAFTSFFDPYCRDRFAPGLRSRMGLSTSSPPPPLLSLAPALATRGKGVRAGAVQGTCVIVHLFDVDAWPLFAPYLANVRRTGMAYDVYMTVARERWTPEVADAVTASCPLHEHTDTVEVVLVDTEDTPYTDTSAFMLALHRITNECRRSYGYLLHMPVRVACPSTVTKHRLSALLGSPERVLECVSAMEAAHDTCTLPERTHGRDYVGLVGSVDCVAGPPKADTRTFLRHGMGSLGSGPVVYGNLVWAHMVTLSDGLAAVDMLKCARRQARGDDVSGSTSDDDDMALSEVFSGIVARAGLVVRGMAPLLCSFTDPAPEGSKGHPKRCVARGSRDFVREMIHRHKEWHPYDTDPFRMRRQQEAGATAVGPHLEYIADIAARCSAAIEWSAHGTTLGVTWALAEGLCLARVRGDSGTLLVLNQQTCNARPLLTDMATAAHICINSVDGDAPNDHQHHDLLVVDAVTGCGRHTPVQICSLLARWAPCIGKHVILLFPCDPATTLWTETITRDMVPLGWRPHRQTNVPSASQMLHLVC